MLLTDGDVEKIIKEHYVLATTLDDDKGESILLIPKDTYEKIETLER
jgi:hypothetical protein